VKRWIEPPVFAQDGFGQWVEDTWVQSKSVEIPDNEAVAVCVELLDGSPVYLAKPWNDGGEYPRNQMWYRHPDHEELVIGVEMKAPTIHDYAVTGKTYIHWVQDALAAAGFQLPFGWNVFSVYGAGGGITNRVYFPCLDRKGGKR